MVDSTKKKKIVFSSLVPASSPKSLALPRGVLIATIAVVAGLREGHHDIGNSQGKRRCSSLSPESRSSEVRTPILCMYVGGEIRREKQVDELTGGLEKLPTRANLARAGVGLKKFFFRVLKKKNLGG